MSAAILSVSLPWRLLLVAGVSALALAPDPAAAQSPLFRGRTNNPAAAAARVAQASVNEQARARVQAQQSMSTFANAQVAISAMLAAQESARQVALAAAATVPNGLTTGGLDLLRIGSTGDPVTPDTFAPTQSGPANAPTVDIVQLRSRAILTWRSFNVGRETTLNFDQATFGGTRAREWSVLNRVEGSRDPVSGRRTDISPTQILGKINAPGQVFVIDRNGIIFGGASQVNVGTLVASALDVGTWGQDTPARDAAFRAGLREQIIDTVNQQIRPQVPNLTVTDLTSTPPGGQATNIGAEIAAARDTDRFRVIVRPGARIDIAEQGFALLASPRQVVNQGSITAASAQVHLAAGAGVQFAPVTDGDAGQRARAAFQAPDIGYIVEALRHNLGASATPPALNEIRAEARNEGLIDTPRGSITLAGAGVTNLGVLSATTAANRAGSVFLIARDFGGTPTQSGTTLNVSGFRFGPVLLGASSVIQIGTESGADQVVFDTATTEFRQSRIGINGSLVTVDGVARDAGGAPVAPGAIIRAPAGRVRIAADFAPTVPYAANGGGERQESAQLQQMQLGSGAVIDVGGLKGVEVPIARNIVDVTVRNQNVGDQPVQRDGFLVGLAQQRIAVVVDLRLGTSLFDFRPFANNTARSVAERQTSGGTVDIAAERVVTQPGSLIDVSGGWLSWQGGLRPSETSLIGSDGRIYRLSNAPADLTYIGRPGLFTRTQPRWGITENYVSPLFADRLVFEPGYIEGFDAGTINIAATPLLAGTLAGGAFTGERQAISANASTPNDGRRETSADLPNGGTLRLYARLRTLDTDTAIPRGTGNAANVGAPNNPTFVTNFSDGLSAPLPDFDPRQPGTLTTFGTPTNTGTGGGFNASTRVLGTLPAELFDTRIPTATTLDNGFSRFVLEAEGRLTVPSGVTVSLRPGWFGGETGGFTANVGNALVSGAIRVPAGRIRITANSADRIVPVAADLDLARRPLARPLPVGLATLAAPAETFDGVPTQGAIIVAAGAVLTTRGLWINDFLAEEQGETRQGPAFTNGGNIRLETRYSSYGVIADRPPVPAGAEIDAAAQPVYGRDILLGAGAVLDVSGGGRVRTASLRPALAAGAAGGLELITYGALAESPAGAAPLSANSVTGAAGLYVGQRNFGREDRYSGIIDRGATLAGFGLAREGLGAANGRGGRITVQAPVVVIGRALTPVETASGVAAPDVDRFAASGFAEVSLIAGNIGFNASTFERPSNSNYVGSLPYRALPVGVLRVAPGSVIAPVPASRHLADDFGAAPTGNDPASFAVPRVLSVADRSPVRLTLAADTELDLGRKATGDAAPTVLRADPGAGTAGGPAVTLLAFRPIYIDGEISASGGAISITQGGQATYAELGSAGEFLGEISGTSLQLGDALWIAAGARLSVAGTASTVTDRFGVTRGAVRDGGTITLNDQRSYLVVEGARGDVPAASLDLSGATTTISVQRGGALFRPLGSQTIASDAGSLDLRGVLGTFLGGRIEALPVAPGARGGTLTFRAPAATLGANNGSVQITRSAALPVAPAASPAAGEAALAENAFAASILIADAARTGLPTTALGAITDRRTPIDPTLVRADATTAVGQFTGYAFLNPETLAGTGIERLNLLGRVVVEGSPQLAVARMLEISGGVTLRPGAAATPPTARLAAAYVLLAGGSTALPDSISTRLAGTLTIAASGQLDILDGVIRGAEQAILESAGDIRLTTAPLALLQAPDTVASATPIRRAPSSLLSQGNLTLRARQTYVDTGAAATIAVRRQAATDPVADPTRPLTIPTVTFASFGGGVPETPLAAGGRLTVRAARIEQAGVLRVPQGEIVLAATDRITLAPGSLTSVAAGGRSVPFGQTRSDQNALGLEIFDTLTNLLNFSGGPGSVATAQPALAGPPTRAISLDAPSVDLQAGATFDLSGDGELLAYRFVAGPGGSRDVLARTTLNEAGGTDANTAYQFSDRRDVFAILPGTQPYAAPRSPYIRDSGDSLGRGDVTVTALNQTQADLAARQPGIGDQIEIGPGIPGLHAGSYTLLPARYAIVPGGFQVVIPPAGTGLRAEVPLDAAVRGGDGRYVVGGYRTVAGTGLRESQQRLVTVRPPEVWQALSQIVVDTHTSFFTQRAAVTETPPPRLPIDAGRLTVTASRQLVLDATAQFRRQAGGRGGQVEISADLLAIAPRSRIVDIGEGRTAVAGADGLPRADLVGFLPVAGEALTALGAESLTLGGRRPEVFGRAIVPNANPLSNRTRLTNAEEFVVTARNVRLAEGAAVTAPEVLLLAGDRAAGGTPGIVLETGSRLAAQGDPIIGALTQVAVGGLGINGTADFDAAVGPFNPVDDPARPGSAMIRVSTGPQINVIRPNPLTGTTPLASVRIDDNATIAGQTATIDLVGNGSLADTVTFAVNDLQIGSPRIVLGTPPTPIPNAIVFGQGVVARLAGVNTLTLIGKGPTPIDVFGGVNLATATRINLDAAGLRAAGGALLALNAGIVELRNTLGQAPPLASFGSGTLSIAAALETRVGTGAFALAGFGSVAIGGGALVATGAGRLDLAAPLTVSVNRVTAATGADVEIATTGPVTLGGAPLAGPGAIGGRLAISGSSIAVGTRLESRGGTLALTATAGDIVLQPGAAIDVRGLPVQFFDLTRYVPGGTARLVASGGISVGGLVDASAGDLAAIEAEAGRVEFTAGGAAVFAAGGQVLGFAAPGARSGSFIFDGSAAVNLPAINDVLDAGGLFEARLVTAGAGDLVVEAGRTMAARQVVLAADAGAVVVAGTIDAGGPKGGTIELWARDRVRLEPGGVLTALNSEAGRRGGTISLGTTAGPLELFGSIAAYRPNESDALYGGRVRLRLPFPTGNASAILASTIDPTRIVARTGAEVMPFRVREVSNGTTAAIDIVPSDLRADFVALAAAASAPGLFAAGLRIEPEIVLSNSTGGLRLAPNQRIDFANFTRAGDAVRTPGAGEGGVLTLRAAGDIEILSDITDGFSPITGAGATRQTGLVGDDRRGWSLRFVAGAANGSANPLATAGTTGDLLIGAPYLYDARVANSNPATLPLVVRTGTGSIELAAARDTLLRDPDAVVYTAGRRLAPPIELLGVNPVNGTTVVVAYIYEFVRFDETTGRNITERFYLPIDSTYTLNGTFNTTPNVVPPNPPSAVGTLAPTIARYPVEGGDLFVRGGRDVRATVLDVSGTVDVGETVNAWQRRLGLTDTNLDFFYRPYVPERYIFGGRLAAARLLNSPAHSSQTNWFPDTNSFAQNWALLGGGDAQVEAGRDFQGSVSIPTSGITYGGLATTYEFSYRTSGVANNNASATARGVVPDGVGGTSPLTIVYGGGDLNLRATRDILAASQIFLGRGDAAITAGGSIRQTVLGPGNTAATVGLVVALADARIVATAGLGISATMYDPFQDRLGRLQIVSDAWGYGGFQAPGAFTTTTAGTRLSLNAIGGSINLLNGTTTAGGGAVVDNLTTAPRLLDASSRILNREEAGLNTVFQSVAATGINRDGDLSNISGPRLNRGLDLPTRFDVISFVGDIEFPVVSIGNLRTTLPLQSRIGDSGSTRLLAGGKVNRPTLLLRPVDLSDALTPNQPYLVTAVVSISGTAFVFPLSGTTIDGRAYREINNTTNFTSVTELPRQADPAVDLVYALGDIVQPRIGERLDTATTSVVETYAKRIGIRAGRDITDAQIYLQHASDGDISFIRAGRDIGTALLPSDPGFGNIIEISGPGRLQVIAGRNISPVRQPAFNFNTVAGVTTTTPGALGGFRSIGNARNPLLPEGGASLDVLFGVGAGQGFDPDALLDRLLDPANAASAYTTYRVELGAVQRINGGTRFLPGTLQPNGGATWFIQPGAPGPTDPATLAQIRALPATERLSLAIDLYFRELGAAGREAAAATGPRQGSYVRAFDAIANLFPNRAEYAGNFNITNTFMRSEQGGDLNVLGAGGDFLIGAVAGGNRAQAQFPDRFGVLTLNAGDINIFADGDIAAGESRIVTLDSGDILAYSSNADINAGLGARTARFVPPFRVSYLPNLAQVPDRAGQITGSGIATFTPFSPPEQRERLRRRPALNRAESERRGQLSAPVGTPDPADAANLPTMLAPPIDTARFLAEVAAGSTTISVEAYDQLNQLRKAERPLPAEALAAIPSRSTGSQVILIAPRGTVDFGDAGVRVAGDLVVAALAVANASNVAVGGTSVGVPTAAAPNVAGALAAASTAGASSQASEAAAAAARNTAAQPQQRPRTLTARVVGWGDTETEALQPR